MSEFKQYKFKFNKYLEKLYQSSKPLIIYKVEGGYNIYTDFSKRIILNKNNIPSWNFDMTSKQGSLPSEVFEHQDVCFLTVGSLEQVGSNWGNFLNFMLDVRPKRSIHIEPIVEFYDSKNEVDKLAIQYHIKRGYLNGFFNGVSELDELKFYQRIPFGNTYNEGFNIIVMEYQ